MKLIDLLAIISYRDNLIIYKGEKLYSFESKEKVSTFLHEDKVIMCNAIAEDVMVIFLEKN